MRKLIALLAAALLPVLGHADDSLMESMTARWNTFIFVSTRMPRQSLLELAREASLSHAVIVLNGFGGDGNTLLSTQKFAAQINSICCTRQPARWIVDPVLVERYRVSVAPTFVVAHGKSDSANEYSRVSGDMSLSQALKFFAQGSKLESAREYATQVYYAAFGGRY